MNYQKIYEDFIEDRKSKELKLVESGDFKEHHHIIPKSLGGNNDVFNMVYLTMEDHIHAHILLASIHGGKMWVAVNLTFGGSKRKKQIPTKSMIKNVAFARIKIAQNMKLNNPMQLEVNRQKMVGQNNHRFGTKSSLETKLKQSLATSGEKHPMYGKNHKYESKKQMSESAKNRGMSKNAIKTQIQKGMLTGYLLKEDKVVRLKREAYDILKENGTLVGVGSKIYRDLKNPNKIIGSTGKVPCFFINTKTFGSLSKEEYYKQKKLRLVVHNKSIEVKRILGS